MSIVQSVKVVSRRTQKLNGVEYKAGEGIEADAWDWSARWANTLLSSKRVEVKPVTNPLVMKVGKLEKKIAALEAKLEAQSEPAEDGAKSG